MQVQWGASPRPPATGRICGVRPLPASGCQGPPQGKEGMRWSPGHLHQELIKRQYSWPLVSTSSRYCLGVGGIREGLQPRGAGWHTHYSSHTLDGWQVPVAEALSLTFPNPVLGVGEAHWHGVRGPLTWQAP